MKLSYLQGKAAAIAGIELNDAMSAFGISGSILAIREIKVSPTMKSFLPTEEGWVGCDVRVIFGEDFYTEILFAADTSLGVVNNLHWRVTRVVTHYHRESLESHNLYLY